MGEVQIMKSKVVIGLMCLFFLLVLVSAEPLFFVEKDADYDIKVSCEIGGVRCSSSAICNLSVQYPNSSYLLNDEVMTNQDNGYFNYTLLSLRNETNITGEYDSRVECSQDGHNDTEIFTYLVNPTGIRPSSERTYSISRSIYFVFGIGLLFLVFAVFAKAKTPVKMTYFIFAMLFFLIGLNIMSISLRDEVVNPRIESFFDSFTSIMWIFYWFLAALLVITWIFTFINTWLFRRNMKNIEKFGNT